MLPDSWATLLGQWADRATLRSSNLLSEAQPEMERTLLTTVTPYSGHKQEAARLLGWGRNTLTRKLKELGMGSSSGACIHHPAQPAASETYYFYCCYALSMILPGKTG